MTNWQFNPYAVPIMLGLVPLVYFGFRAWKNRTTRTAYLFAIFATSASFALGFYVLELFSANTELLIFWVRMRFVFAVFLPAFVLLFVLAYVGFEEWVTWRTFLILGVPPVISLFAIWTNDTYHLQWVYYTTRQVNGLVFAAYQDAVNSPVYWLGQVYVLVISGVLIYIVHGAMQRSPGVLRGQVYYLLIAILLPVSGALFEFLGLRPIPNLNWPVFTLCLSVIPLGLALFRYELLDLLPAAQSLVLHNMQDAVLVVNSQGRVVEANPAASALLHEPIGSIIGHHLNEVFFDVPHLLDRYATVFEAQDTVTVEGKDGLYHYDLRISPLRNHDRRVTGRIIVVRDIGAIKRAEQQALELTLEQERTELIKRFISDTSHDIMTPISVMRVSSYLLRSLTDKIGQSVDEIRATANDNVGRFEELQNTINAMRERSTNMDASALRLQTLVEGMLEMVKLDKQVFNLIPTDINPLIEQTANLQRFLAEEKRIRLEMQLAHDLPKVNLDSNQFIRVLQNLLTNALKYTPQNGVVTLATCLQDGKVILEVRDTGQGIPPDDLPRIFDRLYRVEKYRPVETVGVGLGLGLAIVKAIVTAHDGLIEVESTVGMGSTFRILLQPVAPLHPASLAWSPGNWVADAAEPLQPAS